MKKPVYSYLRVSSKSQVDGDGLPRQRDQIAQFCKENNFQVVGEFAEKGVSGTTECMDRPMFREMLECVANRRRVGKDPVDTIIVERADRLARDLVVGELILAECKKQKIAVYSADRGLVDLASDDQDPTRVLIRQFMGALAQWEKSTLIRKLRLARERAALERGEDYASGHMPYGKGPGEAGIRQLILNMRAEGKSIRQIMKFLRSEGVFNRQGRPFQPSLIWQICETAKKQKERARLCEERKRAQNNVGYYNNPPSEQPGANP